jgi:ribosome maturation factor RimP
MLDEHIRDLLFIRLKKLGYHLIRVKTVNTGRKKTLQIMAERTKDRKMNVEDCTFLSREISAFLEVDDPISTSYTLEVSSGGIARPLTMIEDYKFFKQNKAKIVLKEKFNGKKTFRGFLQGVDENADIILETEEHKIKINFMEIEKANIDPDWAIQNNEIK